MADELRQPLLQRVDSLDHMPSIPAALFPEGKHIDPVQVERWLASRRRLAARVLKLRRRLQEFVQQTREFAGSRRIARVARKPAHRKHQQEGEEFG